jgi:hypothetical protein
MVLSSPRTRTLISRLAKLDLWQQIALGVLAVVLLGAISTGLWYRANVPRADSGFTPTVGKPAFKGAGPWVMIDEAHFNFHTLSGRFAPFAELLRADGFLVAPNRERLLPGVLEPYRIAVLGQPLGGWMPFLPGADNRAIEVDETEVLFDWVQKGGSVLLATDELSGGGATSRVIEQLGIRVSAGRTLEQDPNRILGRPDWITYSPNAGLAAHSVTSGLGNVVVFGGQALRPAEGAVSLLNLSGRAIDRQPDDIVLPVPHWSQALLLEHGKGRIAILADSDMITALRLGWFSDRIGMNRPGNDNERLAVNIMRWLARVI